MTRHRKPRPNVPNSATPSNATPNPATPSGTTPSKSEPSSAAASRTSPSGSGPSSAPPSNFSAGDALEKLYTELVEVEALAQAAGEAVTQLPSTSSRATRRSFARLYALVTRTANEASAALTLGENLVSALSADMAAQRARLELERSAR